MRMTMSWGKSEEKMVKTKLSVRGRSTLVLEVDLGGVMM